MGWMRSLPNESARRPWARNGPLVVSIVGLCAVCAIVGAFIFAMIFGGI